MISPLPTAVALIGRAFTGASPVRRSYSRTCEVVTSRCWRRCARPAGATARAAARTSWSRSPPAPRWLRAYVPALRRAWAALEPLWTRSAAPLDREVERVSVALAHGSAAELLAQLFAVDDDAPPPASLEARVRPQRARILRHLSEPATAGELAALLHAVPSMASHHLRALERAGLVARERDGRWVRVRRTARGTELVSLYA